MGQTTSRAGELFDYAVTKPNGFEARQVCRELEWSLHQFRRAVRSLRSILAGDEINLICNGQGFGQPNRYHLVGDLEKAQPWIALRYATLESQLQTVVNVSSSLVHASDGRTIEGRKARLIHRHVSRLVEDLAELDGRLVV